MAEYITPRNSIPSNHFRKPRSCKGSHCAELQDKVKSNQAERASYNGNIEASQAFDVGSIPIARSRKQRFTEFHYRFSFIRQKYKSKTLMRWRSISLVPEVMLSVLSPEVSI